MAILKLDAQVIQDYDTGTGSITYKLQVERQFPTLVECKTISDADHTTLRTAASSGYSSFVATLASVVGSSWPGSTSVIKGWYQIYKNM